MLSLTTSFLALLSLTHAHTAGWHKGMYCLNGTVAGVDDSNTKIAVDPLYDLTKEDWWFQHDRGCDAMPPADGDFLELPAGGQVTLELAHNRAQTTLSYGGQFAGEWPDGNPHPEDWNGNAGCTGECCIQDDGAMHTSNQSTAAGTALGISYVSSLEEVTMENLVVFSVLEKTPWKRIAVYDIPKALPACPVGGCICAWLWVPKGCGQPNMYMHGYKCTVTGATSTVPVAAAKAPVYCADDPSTCTPGAKQMIAWNQQTGNNIFPPPGASPAYSEVCGWSSGAQNDIFESSATSPLTSTSPSSSPSSIPSAPLSAPPSSSPTPPTSASPSISASASAPPSNGHAIKWSHQAHPTRHPRRHARNLALEKA